MIFSCYFEVLGKYFYQINPIIFISYTVSAESHMMLMQEKFSLLRENETLLNANKRLNQEKENLLKNKDMADAQIVTLTKSLDAMQKDLKDKENLVLPSYV